MNYIGTAEKVLSVWAFMSFWTFLFFVCNEIAIYKYATSYKRTNLLFVMALFILLPILFCPLMLFLALAAPTSEDRKVFKEIFLSSLFPPLIFYYRKKDAENTMIKDIIE